MLRGVGVRGLLAFLAAPAAALLLASVDGDAGLRTWWRLRADVDAAEQRVTALRADRERLAAEREALRLDPFALERAIREDLDWVLPGEILVRLPSQASDLPGIP